MIFRETELAGAFVVEIEPIEDERGWFARIYDESEFAERGLASRFVQGSVAFNSERGTLRGMHYQDGAHAEAKLVRCSRGALHDVIVDLRPSSATFKRWVAVELSAANGRMLYVPEGLAHGYLTLEDETEALYLISTPYAPDAARGVRWNDPAFGIAWPDDPRVVSEKDKAWPDFSG
ncbi:MAG: dTDP-4-dehydrorhamnose 3,5-epimerase [Actinomycetota bacterium]